MRSRILLLRHGQIQANVDGHWHGSTDSVLTDFGVRQAKETGSFLEKNANIGKVFSSPLQRCLHTAHHASGFDLEDIEIVPGFAEMSIGDWEGTPYKLLAEKYDFINRSTFDVNYAAPKGESIQQVFTRFESALTSMPDNLELSQDILVVSHGAALAIALAGLVDGDITKWQNYYFSNCSLTELHLDPKPTLGQLNSSAHLASLG